MEGMFYLNKHLSSWLRTAAVNKQEINEDVENVNQKQNEEDNKAQSDSIISSEIRSTNSTENKSFAELKSIANCIYSTIHETSGKIIKVIEESSLFGEFNKEQETFSNNNNRKVEEGFPPWLGCSNEECLKAECLSLSRDRRNFLRNPPAGVNFQFDYEASFPTALAVMEQDPDLVKMRYNLVPKLIKEEDFWRNYFYRISLICRVNELALISRNESSNEIELFDQINNDDIEFSTKPDAQRRVENLEESWEKELESELQDYAVIGQDENCNVQDDNEYEVDSNTLI